MLSGVPRSEALARLDAAMREKDRADTELREAIRAAHEAGVSQVDLAALTGLHRHTIRAYLRRSDG